MPFQLENEVAAALRMMKEAGPGPALGDVQARRDGLGSNLKHLYEAGYPKEDLSVVQKDFYTTSADGHRVLLRWYSKPKSTSSGRGPAILYIHSGGMVLGEVADFDNMLHYYVSKTGIPLLSVEYRLSPEVRYPKALEDTYAGLVWLHHNAAELGVDASCIATMGESAGGNLAAALCIYAREKSGPSVSKQLLVYPMLSDHSIKADDAIAPYLTWTDIDNKTGWDAYLGPGRRGIDAVPATAAPSRLVDVTGLPPVYLEVGELDMFRDEIVAYADKFWQAGISTQLHVFSGLPHGYDLMMPKARGTQEALICRLNAISSIPVPS